VYDQRDTENEEPHQPRNTDAEAIIEALDISLRKTMDFYPHLYGRVIITESTATTAAILSAQISTIVKNIQSKLQAVESENDESSDSSSLSRLDSSSSSSSSSSIRLSSPSKEQRGKQVANLKRLRSNSDSDSLPDGKRQRIEIV